MCPFCLLGPASKWRSIRVAEGPVNWQLPIEFLFSFSVRSFRERQLCFLSHGSPPFKSKWNSWRTLLQISHTCLALIENRIVNCHLDSWFQSSWLIVKREQYVKIYIIKTGQRRNKEECKKIPSFYLLENF